MTDSHPHPQRQLNFFGIGPRILLCGVISVILTACLGMSHPFFSYDFWNRITVWILAIVFSLVGLYLWVGGGYLLATQFHRRVLIKTGVFRYSRNPIYTSEILFIVPAISLLANNWLILVSALTMFYVFQTNIYREEEDLERVFGKEYLDYKKQVKRIIPFIY